MKSPEPKPLPQVLTNPLPFSVTSAGALYLAEMAATNLHISSLLLALSRSPGDGRGGDWYSPVKIVFSFLLEPKLIESKEREQRYLSSRCVQ